MSDAPATEPPSDAHVDSESTAMQQAIRKRALDTIAVQQSLPVAPLSRRLLIIGLTLVAMLVFLLLLNFVVTGMHKIMDIWYPGSISGRVTQPIPARPPQDLSQPFYISVDPPLETTAPGNGVATSSASAASDSHQ